MGLTKESTLNQNAYKYHTFDIQIEQQSRRRRERDERRGEEIKLRFLKEKEKLSIRRRLFNLQNGPILMSISTFGPKYYLHYRLSLLNNNYKMTQVVSSVPDRSVAAARVVKLAGFSSLPGVDQ